MKTLIRCCAVLALCAALTPPPAAVAGPGSSIFTEYFDCALNSVGARLVECDGIVYTEGQQSGYFRYREWEPCDGGGTTFQWYRWNGSGWTPIDPPSPEC